MKCIDCKEQFDNPCFDVVRCPRCVEEMMRLTDPENNLMRKVREEMNDTTPRYTTIQRGIFKEKQP